MITSLTATVVLREQVTPVHVRLRLRVPEIARTAVAGQFVHLRVSEAADPLLRRPFSLMATEPATGLIDLLIQVVGRGSEAVAAAVPGQTFGVIGPLGNGFPICPPGGQVFLVAGGVGVAPLIFLAESLAEADGEREIHGLFGARTEGLLCCWLELAARCTEFTAVTEDGSAGETGLVSEALARRLEVPYPGPRTIYACGPLPMLAALPHLLAPLPSQGRGEQRTGNVQTYVSLERWMGCGVGACLGCVVPALLPSGTTGVSPVGPPDEAAATATGETPVVPGGERYLRVCKDGPVFPAEALDWEAMPQ